MNRYLLFLAICAGLAGCGGNAISKPEVLADGENYMTEGIHAYANAEWSLARNAFHRALRLYQGIDQQEGVLLSYINLAEVSLAVHDYAESLRYLTLASKIAKYDSLEGYEPRINLLYALVALQQKQLTRAEHRLQQILPAFEEIIPVVIPDTLQLAAIASRTRLAFLEKEHEALWTRRYESALKKAANQNPDKKARLLRFQSRLLLRQGEEKKAELKMQQALSLYKKNLSRAGIAVTLLEIAQYHRSEQRLQKAREYLNRAKAVYEFLGNKEKIQLIADTLKQLEHQENGKNGVLQEVP